MAAVTNEHEVHQPLRAETFIGSMMDGQPDAGAPTDFTARLAITARTEPRSKETALNVSPMRGQEVLTITSVAESL
jgi:hypothetical protein